MRHILYYTCIALFMLLSQPSLAQGDIEGSADHPLFPRMNGYYISLYNFIEGGAYDFNFGEDGSVKVVGNMYEYSYETKGGTKAVVPAVLRRNYTTRIQSLGGSVIYEDAEQTTMKLVRKGKETWAKIFALDNFYTLIIIEKGVSGGAPDKLANLLKETKTASFGEDTGSGELTIEEEVVAIGQAIKKTGRVAIYGINFDAGQSVLKPASRPVIKKIATYMERNPSLKLYIVGHTDMTGDLEKNIQLSLERADAVAVSLSNDYGIDASRLISEGVGPLSPVASNATAAGRAKNRRVELVAR